MSHDWIKPGVKAVVINSRNFPEAIGEVVTIDGEPLRCERVGGSEYLGVSIVERFVIMRADGPNLIFIPRVTNLIPYHEPPNWAKMSGVESKEKM